MIITNYGWTCIGDKRMGLYLYNYHYHPVQTVKTAKYGSKLSVLIIPTNFALQLT